jgi:hypothetical protein
MRVSPTLFGRRIHPMRRDYDILAIVFASYALLCSIAALTITICAMLPAAIMAWSAFCCFKNEE